MDSYVPHRQSSRPTMEPKPKTHRPARVEPNSLSLTDRVNRLQPSIGTRLPRGSNPTTRTDEWMHTHRILQSVSACLSAYLCHTYVHFCLHPWRQTTVRASTSDPPMHACIHPSIHPWSGFGNLKETCRRSSGFNTVLLLFYNPS